MSISGSTRMGIGALVTAICTLGMAVMIAGCQTKAEKDAAFKTALNTYYSNHKDCLWSSPIKLPETANAEDKDETKGFDALVDAGLLQRTGAAKTSHARGEEHGSEYELSDIGRLDWTADPTRQGYGNFCFGHPQVNTIESDTKLAGGNMPQYNVSYRESVTLPAWATMPQVKQAFPKITKDSSGQTATATLMKGAKGWQVQNISPSTPTPMG